MDRKRIMWIVFGVLTVIALGLMLRAFTSGSDIEELTSDVVIRYEDTGDEVKMNRGQFERALLARLHQKELIDAAVGLENPKTGKATGFPVDRAFWNKMIEDVKTMKAQK